MRFCYLLRQGLLGVLFGFLLVTVVVTGQKNKSFEPYRLVCDYDRYDVTEWFSGGNRKLDSNGIIINTFSGKTSYHPLGIVQFGMLSFYEFKTTGDSIYYKHFVNQASYFKDSTKVNFYENGERIGLPYTFDYKDMKAPWYSGMTQGWAIAFLIRYYYQTRDEEIVPIIRKIGQFMIQPVELNGTISKTPEGYTWIEEYPNSKQKPQVLNGFINGLIGLKEYCDFFPSDTTAKRIHDKAYQSLLLTMTKYDTPTWSNYDRKNSPLNNQYLQYQLFEIIDLYHVYGARQFLDQMKIWSYFGNKKYMSEKHKQFRLNNFDVSIQAEPKCGGYYVRFIRNNRLETENKSLQKMMNNENPFVVMFTGKSVKLSYALKPGNHKAIKGYIVVDSAYNGKKVWIELIDTLTEKTRKISCSRQWVGCNQVFNFYIPANQTFQKLDCLLSSPSGKLVTVYDLALTDNYTYNLPFYNFIKPFTLELTKGTYKLEQGKLINGEDYTIFFRYNVKKENLQKEKWSTLNQWYINDKRIEIKNDGFYECLIMYKPLHEHSYIEGFKLNLIQ
jgi:hypothetical protein